MKRQLKDKLGIVLLLSGVVLVILLVMIYAYVSAPDDNQPEKGPKPYILLIGSPMRPDNVSDFVYVSPQYDAKKIPPGNYSGLVRLAVTDMPLSPMPARQKDIITSASISTPPGISPT